MFILYAVVIGLVVGFVLGGRPGALGALKLRWAPVMLGGLLVQVALFSDHVSAVIGGAGPWIYVGSTLAVFAAILANRRVVGMPIVAFGAGLNLTAIIANGGYMPAAPAALASLGKVAPATYSNSSVVADPILAPLTDIFALPTWLPFANVFSIGDVVIGIGIAFVVAVAMRSPEPQAGTGRLVVS